ncbi:hypothetical protein PEL8287_00276 [Roseovarius litorisediminis]|uniref:Invasion associated locus B (IalB) protein n=1 Tax=Roseovarius litorisediminis TaxID=1312363 RepID=A0A1Y5RCD9_9RHOB|nr:hypothetical protein [Roseovarius litorisediminis]SLN11668.1 hypothetical protein PEL8287_00276 [Roseovarius litorisediminis]
MKKAIIHFATALIYSAVISVSAAQVAAADFKKFGRAGVWEVSGQQGQCQIGRSLDAGQMQFVLSKDGTVITLQSLSWTKMRQPPSNTFKITLYLDNKKFVRTDALVIAQVRAFQIFLLDASNPKRQRQFWRALAQSKEMAVSVPFQSSRLRFSVSGIAEAYRLVPKCSQRYLKGVALPF